MTEKPLITVIGSLNMDMVTTAKTMPREGETIHGESFKMVPGGKGANQAIAAARLGGHVQFIGMVGDDPFGHHLIKVLKNEGIKRNEVKIVPNTSTGVATILLSENNNRIIVTEGANGYVTKAYLEKLKERILESTIVLIQFEIPLEAIYYTLEICTQNNIQVVINPAPAKQLPTSMWKKATFITPNETELKELFTARAREHLGEKLIVTKGENGVVFKSHGEDIHIPSYPVEVVDTTGAGDTFNGAFVVALTEGKSIKDSVNFANAAAALSIKKFGAQGGVPNRIKLDEFLNRLRP
ncbi:ribokinase [Evansella cellulosilytica]|uniref:Ribokinase n=1 Tax=Evansella cellulosilytica (strain ATCC 21833 / DSM 2522 / FERM P-1141 / JCM 9156 / N-4) TaxID=649639 RepID=E6TV00_EVAC2|nr:ribokinase [Evansella cellulosilytica]ADU28583.1 ribokinase [Evansella cellulosilytica DSM 2522]